jgi:hypothetical protein
MEGQLRVYCYIRKAVRLWEERWGDLSGPPRRVPTKVTNWSFGGKKYLMDTR